MRPQTIGRVLGTGLRVAGRVASQQLSGEASQPQVQQPQGNTQQRTYEPQGTRSLRKGIGGFFKPFRRVGGIVFLEVMGVLFLLFVLIFVQSAWRYHTDYASGPNHDRFLVSAVLGVVFIYLSLSSFWRARKR